MPILEDPGITGTFADDTVFGYSDEDPDKASQHLQNHRNKLI